MKGNPVTGNHPGARVGRDFHRFTILPDEFFHNPTARISDVVQRLTAVAHSVIHSDSFAKKGVAAPISSGVNLPECNPSRWDLSL